MDENLHEPEAQKPVNNWKRISLVVVLAVAGTALLILSFPTQNTPLAFPGITAPSPTWADFPTRAVETPQPDAEAMAIYRLRIALLGDDLKLAQSHWNERTKLGNLSAEEWYLGATLAIQQDYLNIAADRILEAIKQDSTNPQYWQALAHIYRRQGNTEAAAQSLRIAESFRPDDVSPLANFDERWQTALLTKDNDTLLELALLHSQEQPESALDAYYTSKVLLVNREYTQTIDTLIETITPTGEAPALLWYTLGEAYYAAGGFTEAVSVFEVALMQYAQGDTSLEIALSDPLAEINWHLAQAYYYANQCPEAESVFRRWEETHVDAQTWISRAVICQTPTPTPTPWILSQQSTPTPTP